MLITSDLNFITNKFIFFKVVDDLNPELKWFWAWNQAIWVSKNI